MPLLTATKSGNNIVLKTTVDKDSLTRYKQQATESFKVLKKLTEGALTQEAAMEKYRRMIHSTSGQIQDMLTKVGYGASAAGVSFEDAGRAMYTLRESGLVLNKNFTGMIKLAGKTAEVFNVDIGESANYISTKFRYLDLNLQQIKTTMDGTASIMSGFGVTGQEALGIMNKFGESIMMAYTGGTRQGAMFEKQVLEVEGAYKALGIKSDEVMTQLKTALVPSTNELQKLGMMAGLTGTSIQNLMVEARTSPKRFAIRQAQMADYVVRMSHGNELLMRQMANVFNTPMDMVLRDLKLRRDEHITLSQKLTKEYKAGEARARETKSFDEAWQKNLSSLYTGLDTFSKQWKQLWATSLRPFFLSPLMKYGGKALGGLTSLMAQAKEHPWITKILGTAGAITAGFATVVSIFTGFRFLKTLMVKGAIPVYDVSSGGKGLTTSLFKVLGKGLFRKTGTALVPEMVAAAGGGEGVALGASMAASAAGSAAAVAGTAVGSWYLGKAIDKYMFDTSENWIKAVKSNKNATSTQKVGTTLLKTFLWLNPLYQIKKGAQWLGKAVVGKGQTWETSKTVYNANEMRIIDDARKTAESLNTEAAVKAKIEAIKDPNTDIPVKLKSRILRIYNKKLLNLRGKIKTIANTPNAHWGGAMSMKGVSYAVTQAPKGGPSSYTPSTKGGGLPTATPKAAFGGFFNKPTNVTVGEGSDAELVAPVRALLNEMKNVAVQTASTKGGAPAFNNLNTDLLMSNQIEVQKEIVSALKAELPVLHNIRNESSINTKQERTIALGSLAAMPDLAF